jgi:hypothetical protein
VEYNSCVIGGMSVVPSALRFSQSKRNTAWTWTDHFVQNIRSCLPSGVASQLEVANLYV